MAEPQDMKISNEKQSTQATRIISRITMFFVKHTIKDHYSQLQEKA